MHAHLKRTLSAASLMLWLVLSLTACYDQNAWPTIHGDARNSDTSPAPGFTDLALLWTRDFPGYVAAAATIDGEGQVYVTTTGDDAEGSCHLFVVDLATGVDKWCSAEVNRWVVGSSVLIDINGNLFVGDDEAMHSFDRDGKLRWETPTVGAPISAQFLSNGHIIFVTHIGQVMVLKRSTGELVTPVYEMIPGQGYTVGTGLNGCLFGSAACPSANTLSVDLASNRFYNTLWPPGGEAAELRALQYDDSSHSISPLWANSTLGGGTASSPVISADGSRIYVNDNDGYFLALDALTGQVIWQVDIGFAPAGSPSVTPGGRGIPAGADGSSVLAVQDNGASGSIIWENSALTNLGVSVQVRNNISYVAVRKPGTVLGVDVLSINALSGSEYSRVTIIPPPVATVGTSIAADGTIVVAGLNGVIAALGEAPAE